MQYRQAQESTANGETHHADRQQQVAQPQPRNQKHDCDRDPHELVQRSTAFNVDRGTIDCRTAHLQRLRIQAKLFLGDTSDASHNFCATVVQRRGRKCDHTRLPLVRAQQQSLDTAFGNRFGHTRGRDAIDHRSSGNRSLKNLLTIHFVFAKC